jgi:hypothetical protein
MFGRSIDRELDPTGLQQNFWELVGPNRPHKHIVAAHGDVAFDVKVVSKSTSQEMDGWEFRWILIRKKCHIVNFVFSSHFMF